MKKSGVILLVILLLISVTSSVSFVSAGFWSDLWGKITGKVAEENITVEPVNETPVPEPEPAPKECPPVPISMWCPNCDIEKYGNRCLCPQTTDESGCAVWDCDACGPIFESKSIPESKIICCKIATVAPGMTGAKIEYIWRSETECPPSELPDGTSYEIVSNEYCEEEKLCTDSDGGRNYYVKGTTKGVNIEGTDFCGIRTVSEYSEPIVVDSCQKMEWKSGQQCTLYEFACGTSPEFNPSHAIRWEHECPYGCKDGACVKEGKEAIPEVPPTEVVRICAAKIKITPDKEIYYYGDDSKVIVEIFDSQGLHLPYYSFYMQIYTYHDEIWHTPEEGKTDEDGYRIYKGKIEEGKQALGKVKIKVYTPDTGAYADCASAEETITAEIRRREEPIPEPVPCGIGKCVPEPEPIIESVEIPEERVLYTCMGCELAGKCYPMGYRKEGRYCSDDYEFIAQIEEGKCDNNFECKGNICVAGECISESLLEKIIDWFKELFGIKPKLPVLKECSKLLIEKNIGDYEYVKSEYGESEHTQVPLFSKDGKHLGVIKCCAAEYVHEEKREEIKATIVCPYNNREDLRNSLIWILAKEGILDLIDYKGERVLGDINEAIVWTNNAYLVASGGDPKSGTPIAEDIAEAYLKRYPSDLDITEDDTPEIKPEPWVFCTEEDKKVAKKCHNLGGAPQSDPHPDKECEVYTGCIMPDEDCEKIDIVGRDECYWHVARLNKDADLCEKISDSHYKDKCLRDVTITTQDSSVCEKITDINEKEDCYVKIADMTKDASVCEKISDDSKKEKCYLNIVR